MTKEKFLDGVPKLSNATRMMFRGVEVTPMLNIENGMIWVRNNDSSVSIVNLSSLKPIPKLTHWEASDFHKWFAENGMNVSWIKTKDSDWSSVYTMDDSRIWIHNLCHTKQQSFNISEITSIKADGETTKCTKPSK